MNHRCHKCGAIKFSIDKAEQDCLKSIIIEKAMIGLYKLEKKEEHSEEECSICLEKLKISPIVETTCGHKFHEHCLLNCFFSKSVDNATCPCCRKEFFPNN